MIAGAGLSVLIVAMTVHDLRRYGFLLMLITLILFIHSAQAHKEYRYVFAVIPLWLIVGAGLVARLAAGTRMPAWVYGASGVAFAAVSLAGILNALPSQHDVYESTHTPKENRRQVHPRPGPSIRRVPLPRCRAGRPSRCGRSTVIITASLGTITCTARSRFMTHRPVQATICTRT